MANTIKIKRKLTTGAPSLASLVDGEMCLVVPDSALYQRVDATTLIQVNGGGGLSKGVLQHGGRLYCYTDNRWISFFDDNYGSFTENQSESGGTGVVSLNEWEWQGAMIPSGAILKRLTFIGRTNNIEVTDLQIVLSERTPNPVTRWETGFDNDAEDGVVDILSDTWWDSVNWGGNIADKHKRTYDLGDYVWSGDGELLLSLKPVGTITATRYFYSTWMLEYEF